MTDAGSARVDPNNLFRVCLRTARAATEGKWRGGSDDAGGATAGGAGAS